MGDFHQTPFDEGTLTKLDIFELYAREWFPVFLSKEVPYFKSLCVFDFFAGPGTDSVGQLGSPLRLLRQLTEFLELPGAKRVEISFHFFDSDPEKVRRLRQIISEQGLDSVDIRLHLQSIPFEQAFAQSKAILNDRLAAKLVLIDQFGVSHVTRSVFEQLIRFSTCDFLFFISSSTLHRFRDVPAIKQKIGEVEDPHHVHRAALDYYRKLIPEDLVYNLAPFSIRKGSNIYGLIFGSAHPRGIDKFLEVAWKKDELNGEANFDVNRDNLDPGSIYLPLLEFQPTKLSRFESELEAKIRDGLAKNERDVILICHEHGVRRVHSNVILKKLKDEGVIDCDFQVPQIARLKQPRAITLL